MAIKTNNRLKTEIRLRVFLVFLILTIIFWLLINLSKTYTSNVEFVVEYDNLPADKDIQNEPINLINATLVSTGFNLFRYKFKSKKIVLDVEELGYKKGSTFYYLPNDHLFELKSQLKVGTAITRIYQDTIFIDLGINLSKKIPVELDSDIQFKLGYNLTEKIKISPDSVTIIGPESQLDTIYSIKSVNLRLYDVSDSIYRKVNLVAPFSNKVTLSTSEVEIFGYVDRFTEGSLTVPFSILNLPNNYKITTFPSEVKLVFQVGLSNFNKITPDNFQVICDFEQSLTNELNYLIPVLNTIPSIITNVKIVPEKIDFLIEE